ncbi:DUF4158 domain-containing protein [Nonomuraea dietziae]|uniref:DUF4158 domain-containing protein n=1 Tax=Nonomuraea dietziae TaxID=65515 RepID=UPI0033EA0A71
MLRRLLRAATSRDETETRLGAGGSKTGATRLGFSLILKFFEQEARFPRQVGELPKAAVDYVTGQAKVDPALLAEYDWSGRSGRRPGRVGRGVQARDRAGSGGTAVSRGSSSIA